MIDRFPDAEAVEVPSHWQIPELRELAGNVDRWVRGKTGTLVLGVKNRRRPGPTSARPTGSRRPPPPAARWPAPTAPCRIARATPSDHGIRQHRPDHQRRRPDRYVPAAADRQGLLRHEVRQRAPALSRPGRPDTHPVLGNARPRRPVLDIRTSRVAERIAAIDDFVAAGYEVHLNLSPVVLRDGWAEDWTAPLQELDDVLSPAAKQQAAAEVILLTHNRDLHEVNLGWHPRTEELLWRPDLQQPKRSGNGQDNVRYRDDIQRAGVRRLRELIAAHAPRLDVRYAF